jgi:hypothetical protein
MAFNRTALRKGLKPLKILSEVFRHTLKDVARALTFLPAVVRRTKDEGEQVREWKRTTKPQMGFSPLHTNGQLELSYYIATSSSVSNIKQCQPSEADTKCDNR